MQIHLLFECGEDCFTSPRSTLVSSSTSYVHSYIRMRWSGVLLLCVVFPSGWFVSRSYRRTDFAASPHFVCSLLQSCSRSFASTYTALSEFIRAHLYKIIHSFLHPFPSSRLHNPFHHMCILKPNYAMYKRSSSGKYYFIHLTCLMRIRIHFKFVHPFKKDFRFRSTCVHL